MSKRTRGWSTARVAMVTQDNVSRGLPATCRGEWSSLAASKLRGASETGAGPAAPPMGAAPRADPASSVRAPPASANGSKGGTSNESGVAPAAPRPARGLMFDARAYGDL